MHGFYLDLSVNVKDLVDVLKNLQIMLTKLVLGLDGILGGNDGAAANSIAGADSEQVHGILIETTDTVLWGISTVCRQRPGLTLHISSLYHVCNDLTSAITLRLLPCQTDLTVRCVDHSQVLDGSGDI